MKKIFFFLLLSMPLIIVAQNPVLLKIDNKNEITLDEFKRIYLKNSVKDDELLTQEAVEDYLNLFINFKLKVYEAMQLGMNQRKEFTNELKKYRDQLAEPY
ncbi:MAG TPA: peptidylprolyl isomerase, partial [Salinivirgaceae bacterium]|nr:peptidylprolyl isomerase [Salinivirgaceae bacterium]